ncbi:Uncharacterised protein [Serratia fonticola]|uniref:PFL domain-containing protein n=1 Tax=Serratia fonticola TaxID=47917 RepID=A0A4U9TVU6_SERFO|nr:Uncharacterised protein [Serratia fonticola]
MVLFDSYQGLDTGELSTLKTYEEFDNAVKAQIAHIVKLSAIGTVISQRVHRECSTKTADVAAGGRLYGTG